MAPVNLNTRAGRRKRRSELIYNAEIRKRKVLCLLIMLELLEVRRQWWVHPLWAQRKDKGEFYVLYPDLRHFHRSFFGAYRMSVAKFDALLKLLEPDLRGKWTNMREPLSAEFKLVLTLT